MEEVLVGDVLNPQSLDYPIDRHLAVEPCLGLLLSLVFSILLEEGACADPLMLLLLNLFGDLDVTVDQLPLHESQMLVHVPGSLHFELFHLVAEGLLRLFDFILALKLNAFHFCGDYARVVLLGAPLTLPGPGRRAVHS